MKELSVERHLQRRCARHYAPVWCIKGERLGKGWPDRLLLAYPARIAFVELKRPGVSVLRRRQSVISAALRALGFTCEKLFTVKAVDDFMDGWLIDVTEPLHRVEELME